MNNPLSKMLKGTSANALGLVCVAIINFALIPIMLGHLGMEKFGLVVIANIFSIIGLVSIFDLGIPGALTREVGFMTSNYSISERDNLFRVCVLLFVAIGLGVSFLFIGLSEYLFSNLIEIPEIYFEKFIFALWILFGSFIFQFPLLIFKSFLQGVGKFGLLQSIVVGSELLRSLIVVMTISFDKDFDAIIIANSLAPISQLLGCIYVLRNQLFLRRRSAADFSLISSLAKLSSLIFVGRISSLLFNSVDKILVASLLGPIASASLELFSKIPQLVNRVLGLSVSTIVPIVSGMDQVKESSVIKQIYHDGFRLYYFVVAMPIVSMIYFSEEILMFWVGTVDPVINNCIRLLLIWCCVVPLAFGSNILIGMNKGVLGLTYFRIAQSLFKVVSVYFLIGTFELYSVPISFLISCLPLVYLGFCFKRYLGVNLLRQAKDISVILACAIAPFVFLNYLGFGNSSSHLLSVILAGTVIWLSQVSLGFLFLFSYSEKVKIFQKFTRILGWK